MCVCKIEREKDCEIHEIVRTSKCKSRGNVTSKKVTSTKDKGVTFTSTSHKHKSQHTHYYNYIIHYTTGVLDAVLVLVLHLS